MKPYFSSDEATPWVGLGVQESCVVGLTMEADTMKTYPYLYKYQVGDNYSERMRNK